MFLGWYFKGTPADAPHSWWPYFGAGYGLLATITPWLIGISGNIAGGDYAQIDRDEFSMRSSLWLFVFYALPLTVSAHWLATSPYYILSVGCWALAALWVVHLFVAIVVLVRGRGGAGHGKPD